MEEEEFIKAMKRGSGIPKRERITNSYGVYDYYKYYRKNKPTDSKYKLTESQYFHIIRRTNELLIESFLNGDVIKFPYRLGRLILKKGATKVSLVNNTIQTTYPIDWNATLKLWYEDEYSRTNKILVRIPTDYLFKIYYEKKSAIFPNKCFYTFTPVRSFKQKVKQAAQEKTLDTVYT